MSRRHDQRDLPRLLRPLTTGQRIRKRLLLIVLGLVLIALGCLLVAVGLSLQSEHDRAEAKTSGTYIAEDPETGCPTRVAYRVEGRRYVIPADEVESGGTCLEFTGSDIDPSVVWYPGDDPGDGFIYSASGLWTLLLLAWICLPLGVLVILGAAAFVALVAYWGVRGADLQR